MYFQVKILSLQPDFQESEAYKEIFGSGSSADLRLLLLRYQHVLTYPHHQRVISSPLSPWRIKRAQPQWRSVRHHRYPVQFPVGGCRVLPWFWDSFRIVIWIIHRVWGAVTAERGVSGAYASRSSAGVGIPDQVGDDNHRQCRLRPAIYTRFNNH